MKSGIQVADAMTINVISVTSDFTLPECAKVMDSNHIGAVIVKDNGASLGIITEKDIVRKAVAKGVSIKKAKVRDFMETELITINPDADIYDALTSDRPYRDRYTQDRAFEILREMKCQIDADIVEILIETESAH